MKHKDTHYLAFNDDFFAKWQKILLWLLNAPIIKYWFRWIMCIHNYDCSLDEKIIKVAPNYFTIDAGLRYFNEIDLLKTQWENPDNSRKYRRLAKRQFIKIKLGKMPDKKHLLPALKTDFRTHQKWSKRLYFAFKPMWWAMHYWDEFFADRFAPAFSFGFSVLTAYPAAGNNTPVDGDVSRESVNQTFTNIRAGAGTLAETTPANGVVQLTASATTNQFSALIRQITLFDTSSLTAGATISATSMSYFGNGKLGNLGSPEMDIVASTPAATNILAASDYGQLGLTPFASKTYAAYSTSAYNDFSLDASGIANVSKTGISKFGARLNWDTDNNFTGTWVLGDVSRFAFYTADQTGTSNDPKLVVTYTTIQTFVRAASVSTSNSVSRLAAVSRIFIAKRIAAISVSNAVSRLATVAYIKAHAFSRSVSVSVSNSVGRLATAGKITIFVKIASASVSNASSRLATVAKMMIFKRSISVSVSNAMGRLATIYFIVTRQIDNVLFKAFSITPKGKSKTVTPQGKSKVDKAN